MEDTLLLKPIKGVSLTVFIRLHTQEMGGLNTIKFDCSRLTHFAECRSFLP
jgi:hypothetical protein